MQRIVLGFCSLAISAVCASPILASEEKFKAVTTFTVIADMARKVAGDANRGKRDQGGSRNPRLSAYAP